MKTFWIFDWRLWIGPTTAAILVLSFLAAPLAAVAQQPAKIPRVGVLRPGSSPDPYVDAFRQGLRDLGYVEGQTSATPSSRRRAGPAQS